MGYTWLRLELEDEDMHSFAPTFDICEYDLVCVTLPKTSAIPQSLTVVMDQFRNAMSAALRGGGNAETQVPIFRITFSLDDEQRYKKVDDLHKLMQFKFDDENDAALTVKQESRRTQRDGNCVFDGTIQDLPFKLTREYRFVSYYTDADEQTYMSFFTDPMWDATYNDRDDDGYAEHDVLCTSMGFVSSGFRVPDQIDEGEC